MNNMQRRLAVLLLRRNLAVLLLRRGLALLLASVLPAVVSAQAQTYPMKPVRMVTGSSAGGGSDLTARAIAQRLAEVLAQQVIVDNRPGAAGMLANEFAARQPPDGYTLLLQPGSFVTLSTQLNVKTPWDPSRHLTPILQVSAYDFVLVVHPSVPARSVKELVAVAKAKPRALSFVSTGVGSNFHLAGELFKLRAGVDMWHVPYKGSPPALVDLIAGRAEVMFVHAIAINQYVKNGRLRALAVTGLKPNAVLPDLPPVASTLPGYEITGSEGLFAPLQAPRDIVARLNATVSGILNGAELREAWVAKGVEFTPNTPEQYAAKLRDEFDKTAVVIKTAGIKAD